MDEGLECAGLSDGRVVSKLVGFFSRQERPFKVNLVRSMAQNFSISISQQYQAVYTLALGATPFQLGLANGVGGIASALISAPAGWLIGKYGIRNMYLVATPIWILSSLLFAAATDWLTVIPALFAVSLSMRLMLTSCSMVCGSYLKSEDRVTGMQLCDTVSSIPRIFAPVLAAYIITLYGGLTAKGIRPVYYLQAAALLVMLLVVVKWFDDPLRRGARAQSKGFSENLRQVFKEGTRVWTWTVFTVISTIGMAMGMTYVSVYAQQIKSADQFLLGNMASISVVVPLLLSLAVGRLADVIGRKRTLLMLTPAYALNYVLLLVASSPLLLLASGFFQGFGMLIWITENAVEAELIPLPLLAGWFGFLGLFRGFASVGGPVLGGMLWSGLGPETVFYTLILLEAAKMAILLRMPETLKKRDLA